MENLDKYTPIELQKIGNDIKVKHDLLKEEIVKDTYDIENLEKQINKKVNLLDELEKNYVKIIEKLVE